MLKLLTSLPVHYLILGIFLFLAAWWGVMRVRRRAGIWKLRYFALPRPWLLHVHRFVPLYRRVPVELRAPYQDKVLQFVDGKNFKFSDPMKLVDEEARLAVAGTACMLLLNGSGEGCHADVLTVQLWPEGTTVADVEGAPSRPVKSVALIWREETHEAVDPRDLENETLPGIAKGLGWELPGALVLAPWARQRMPAYKAHGGQVPEGLGGTEEDVFAVGTEMFYKAPERLQKGHPKFFGALRSFYCVDPSRWRNVS